ncbi:hypothetical protein QJS10_CPB17g00327 [Acorus calamus]|uniref:Uncharacterized protein n=1 Tax=Acorus calamus TaxID=4465 RepID=A0AAV9CX96_ACOCL|nr:hypothetical protein QJS10_CPB17g00327 [Acorus calamus]
MAEPQETHIIEIPSAEPKLDHHPLKEISESPGHLLLLKLWQREEDLRSLRIGHTETHLDSLKREVFRLCSAFLAFHAVHLTLLFAFSTHPGRPTCPKWWVPSSASLSASAVVVWSVQARVRAFWRASRGLQRERCDARALTRCVQELRMKGRSFDLSKEPALGSKRLKCSSGEGRWTRPIGWCRRYLVTVVLIGFMGIVVPACKFIVCG